MFRLKEKETKFLIIKYSLEYHPFGKNVFTDIYNLPGILTRSICN